MGFLDAITGKSSSNGRKPVIPRDATFRITETGRDKLQEFNGDARSRILVALETRGTSNLDEVAQASRLNRGIIERLIPVLIRNGYIQYASTVTSNDG